MIFVITSDRVFFYTGTTCCACDIYHVWGTCIHMGPVYTYIYVRRRIMGIKKHGCDILTESKKWFCWMSVTLLLQFQMSSCSNSKTVRQWGKWNQTALFSKHPQASHKRRLEIGTIFPKWVSSQLKFVNKLKKTRARSGVCFMFLNWSSMFSKNAFVQVTFLCKETQTAN